MMKYSLIFVCITGLFFLTTSCKKSDVSHNNSIKGIWELKQIRASYTINYSSGKGNLLKFTDSSYEITSNGQLSGRGVYSIINDLTVQAETGFAAPAGKYTRRIIYDNDTSVRKVFIEISNNTLTLFSGENNVYDSESFTTYSKK